MYQTHVELLAYGTSVSGVDEKSCPWAGTDHSHMRTLNNFGLCEKTKICEKAGWN